MLQIVAYDCSYFKDDFITLSLYTCMSILNSESLFGHQYLSGGYSLNKFEFLLYEDACIVI